MLAYARAFAIQVGGSALAFASYSISRRLARWLLMCADRVGPNDITLTHDALSIMLGVRRAGVTIALNELATAGGILLRRGTIVIVNRDTLERRAGAGYGEAKESYQRLIGPS